MEGEKKLTSSAKLLMAFQSNLGNTLTKNSGFKSWSTRSSSASRGCRGKAAVSCLQALRAQVRKLRVRSFIFRVCCLRRFFCFLSVVLDGCVCWCCSDGRRSCGVVEIEVGWLRRGLRGESLCEGQWWWNKVTMDARCEMRDAERGKKIKGSEFVGPGV